MTSVLITGARGFIASHLAPRLSMLGYDVIPMGREYGDLGQPETWCSVPAVDVVVQLAAMTSVAQSWAAPADTLERNSAITVNALEYCRLNRARTIFLSTFVYGDCGTEPIAEDRKPSPSNPYALSKIMGEEACRFYAEYYAVPAVILRPFNVYGYGQANSFLIPALIEQIEAGGPIRVKDLEPRRDYIHVTDVVEAITAAITHPISFGVYNVGTGVSHSVADVIALLQKTWKSSLPVETDAQRRPGEIMDTRADIRRAAQDLGWTPRVDLAGGLRAIYETVRA